MRARASLLPLLLGLVAGVLRKAGVISPFGSQDPAPPHLQHSAIKIGGFCNSLEVYGCQPGSQSLVVSQISNWIKAERYSTDYLINSLVFASLDGTRVVHTTGWRVGEERELLCAFNDYRYRANSRDGTPAALKENSHMYECRYSDPRQAGPSFTSAALDAYPLYSFDLFNCHAAKGCALLEETLIAATGTALGRVPGLESLHVLRSTDDLVCVVMGVWGRASDGLGLQALLEEPGFSAGVARAMRLSVRGCYSDVVYGTSPPRMFCLVDANLMLPDPL